MSLGSTERPKRSAGKPPEQVTDTAAGQWATYIKNTVPGLMHVTHHLPMAPGMATTCTMDWGGNAYAGTSNSNMHGEVDSLNQAEQAGENLALGTFQALSNPVCMVCCAVLYAVGITNVPEKAGATKEYGNYSLPGWIFAGEAPGGYLNRLLGNTAFATWMTLSPESRQKDAVRRMLITGMTQRL